MLRFNAAILVAGPGDDLAAKSYDLSRMYLRVHPQCRAAGDRSITPTTFTQDTLFADTDTNGRRGLPGLEIVWLGPT
jgi:hypothetical protein